MDGHDENKVSASAGSGEAESCKADSPATEHPLTASPELKLDVITEVVRRVNAAPTIPAIIYMLATTASELARMKMEEGYVADNLDDLLEEMFLEFEEIDYV